MAGACRRTAAGDAERVAPREQVADEREPTQVLLAAVELDRELLERQELRTLGAAVDAPGDHGQHRRLGIGRLERAARKPRHRDQVALRRRNGDRPRNLERRAAAHLDPQRAAERGRCARQQRNGRHDGDSP